MSHVGTFPSGCLKVKKKKLKLIHFLLLCAKLVLFQHEIIQKNKTDRKRLGGVGSRRAGRILVQMVETGHERRSSGLRG